VGEYKIMFSGEVLPGHDPAMVRERLVTVLKASPQVAERLFSGKPVSLKSGLDEAQAQAYRRKLAAMGVGVRVETPAGAASAPPEHPRPAVGAAAGLERVPAAGPEQARSGPENSGETAESALALVEAVLADTMACPACGHVQGRRNLCQSCGVDMARVLEARRNPPPEAASAAAAMASPAAMPGVAGAGSQFHEALAERPSLLGFSFVGRMGRLSYLLGGLALTLATAFAVVSTAALGPVAAAVAVTVMSLPAWRLSVLRLHDINWSGWLSLLLLVPVVGNLLALVLLFVPGTEGGNDYGPQAESHGWKPVLIALAAVVAGMSILLPWSLNSYQGYVQRAKAVDDGQYLGAYDPDRDEIVLFSRGDCRPCGQRRQQLAGLGVRFEEFFVDEDSELSELLSARLRQAGHSGQLSLPVIEVNGVLLPGNPSLREMSLHFGAD